MWLSVLASILSIGVSWSIVYFVYLKIRHPDVIFSARKNILDIIKVSIPSTFYTLIFYTKVFCSAFLLLQFGFETFWHKKISATGVLKMLIKLTLAGLLCCDHSVRAATNVQSETNLFCW